MAKPVRVTVKKDKLADFKKSIESLTLNHVLVGIPAENAVREADPETGKEPEITNAAIGYIQENGSPEVGIPPRPHLVPGVRSVRDKIVKRFNAASKAALAGNTQVVERQLGAAGLEAATAVKNLIDTGVPPELAHSTLDARVRRGFFSMTPLLVTGALRNSYTYVIRKYKK